ncbi:MAG: hypothetical protein ACOYL3_28400 [Desulfuromonadaceae bacterium]
MLLPPFLCHAFDPQSRRHGLESSEGESVRQAEIDFAQTLSLPMIGRPVRPTPLTRLFPHGHKAGNPPRVPVGEGVSEAGGAPGFQPVTPPVMVEPNRCG